MPINGAHFDYEFAGSVREIFPGFFVGSEVRISIPHPDPCIVLMDDKRERVLRLIDGCLLIFSDQKIAGSFIKKAKMEGKLFPEIFSWEDFVERFEANFKMAIIEIEGTGLSQKIPLIKGI